MSYRLLHLSDLHLERSFAGSGCQGDLARRRRQGLRDALRRAGEEARVHGCQLVSIGGDLYEHERADVETGRFLAETFASWAPLRVALAPGNHDPLVPGSLYSVTEWPDNVHLFTETRLAPLELEPGLTLWGLAHQEPVWLGDPLGIDVLAEAGNPAGIHLALFHGAEMGSRPDGKSVHGPFHAARIRQLGFSAALCGHYHRRRMDLDTGLVYPGTPEPLSFDDDGRRGPVVVEVGEDGRLSWQALDVNSWTALSVGCDMEGVTSATAARDRVCAELLTAAAGRPLERTLARVDLTGCVPPSVALDVYTLESGVRDSTGLALVRIRDRTQPEVDAAAAAADRTGRGAFTRAALQAIEDAGTPEQRALLEEALRYGLQALSGVEVGLK
ncbi:MAG: exonuclease SbcCD subunit D [Candidatus Dormibacteria bacterium]